MMLTLLGIDSNVLRNFSAKLLLFFKIKKKKWQKKQILCAKKISLRRKSAFCVVISTNDRLFHSSTANAGIAAVPTVHDGCEAFCINAKAGNNAQAAVRAEF